jgi:hypothetical protein
MRPATKYIVEVGSEGLLVLTVGAGEETDELAQRILSSLKTSTTPPCFLPLLEETFGIIAGPNPAAAQPTAQAPPPLVTYNSAMYGWSASYPKGWKVDDSKSEFVLVQAPDKSGHCGFHTAGIEDKFKTAEAWADFMLSAREKHFGNVKSLMRQPVKLPSGLSAIESLADIQATGRSHQLFVVAGGEGYIVDCETEIPNWRKLALLFERVLRSFNVPNLTELTEADTAPARTFHNPKHPWSLIYPGGWELNASDPGEVNISRPNSFAYAGCRINSRSGAQSALDDFADSSLRRNAESQQKRGVQVRATSRKNISLPKGVTGIEVLREMKEVKAVSGDGRSRVVFILADGMSYILECETDVRMWDTLAPLFDQIISSFSLEKKR